MSDTFQQAVRVYRDHEVDVEAALARLNRIAISLHCWQGDDVGGFESAAGLDGGLAVTGNYPGRARTPEELRSDIDFAFGLIPGLKRLNLHAIYADSGSAERDELTADNFAGWLTWAKHREVGLDFNPTFFSHPMAASGFTLSSADDKVRAYWVKHGIACRRIAAAFGRELGNCCINNVWIPDGYKDVPADRLAPRERLRDSLDQIFAEKIETRYAKDAVESKLFGIGSESYVVGSHEFYMGYALKNSKLLCLDSGHFHPTESIADKFSSMLLFADELLLHVSRGVRWDSDHVVLLNDELKSIAEEVVRYKFDSRIHIGLDYFDASINRIAAWVIGARNIQRALLLALLESPRIRRAEQEGDYTTRLALQEEARMLPAGEIWAEFCRRHNCNETAGWLEQVRTYEKNVLSKRG